ncbi:hypothetical protein QYE76_057576 [Lolium multiflorum]|uniref:Uncharacterized protein n=1 Tax=Lolium multiflorum TaxID=4521 RepID=A0AAD8T3M8_LOLMU|nr:hypothetical protein QYE76_057576 [Lolium multiflorum]
MQWIVCVDLRGTPESPPTSRIQFSVLENSWMDGLARAMKEALARLCGLELPRIRGTRYFHMARHDSMGALIRPKHATIAKSRQIENTETPNATIPVKSPELEYSSDDLDEDYVELDDDFIEKCNATTDARKIKKLLAEHAKRTPEDEELLAKIGRNHDDWSTPEPTPTPIVKKRGMIKLNDEDMREAKKSLKEKGIKPEDVKNLPPIEDICETIPPSSTIEYMKDIVTNKRKVPNEEISTMLANYSFNGKIPKKLGDPGAVIDCNKGMVTFNVDDKEHTVYFPKRIDKDFKFNWSRSDPMVQYKIYNKAVNLPFSVFCAAIGVPQWGSCEKIRGTPRELSDLYTRICNGRSLSNDDGLSPHPELKSHVDHTDYMLCETYVQLDNARSLANFAYHQMAQKDEITKIIAAERRTLRRENAKKDYKISRLRDQIANLKETIKTQEDQLKALESEGEGEDIQGDGYSYVSNDNDYEEDDDDLAYYPYEDGHEHLTAGMEDTVPIRVDEA